MNGRPISEPWVSENINAIIEAWEPGSFGGLAIAEIIFGKRDHCEVGGPILIAKVSNDVASQDLISFMSLVALISINLGLNHLK